METLHLELYVIGQSARSLAAIANLERICRDHVAGRFELVIVDVLDHPEAAEEANIVATPTLIRRKPGPVKRVVGDLSLTEAVLRGLGIDDAPVADGGINHG
jgi:circadian clock protein KaiB